MNLVNLYLNDLQSAKEALNRSIDTARTARDHFMSHRLSLAVAEIDRAIEEHMDKTISNLRRLGYVSIPQSLDDKAKYEEICGEIYGMIDKCCAFLRGHGRLIERGVGSPIAVMSDGRRVHVNEMHRDDVKRILSEIRKGNKNETQ